MTNLPPAHASKVSHGCFCCVQKRHSSSSQSRAAATSSPSAKHLIIMVNGIVGSANNWKFAADQFTSKYGSEVLVHCSARNSSTLTFDGIDVMGHRLAEEVKEVVSDSPNLTKISFVAHSLGGLIARYAIGQLFSQSETMPANNTEEQETSEPLLGTILGLQPANFVTVATPHIGLRGNWQLPFLCGIAFLEKLAGWKGYCVVGRTGKHLFLADGVGSQTPLLRRMVSDCSQGFFMSGLKAFQRRVAYANSTYDHMVGWRTATFRREYELPKLRRQPLDPKYPHVIHIEDVPANTEKSSTDKKPALCPVEEEMISGLRQVAWQRVDVSFAGTVQRFAAHSTIQVKYFWMHSEGADVIAHIVDNFVL
ncbi:hypothetical protein GOP47_0015408 [Adiantum capillus-veneris]|uniref:DUF676 domain-containing protein n=1 Tax=Adiantum capillus-veneris TaxID=13818 RepID=A0A9D4UJY8_ADICA|nr:hypothetical protein GOP47_0015408 [Adiantum capillus-veneris]